MKVRLYIPTDQQAWDDYVGRHPDGTHCHLSGWQNVIQETYGHPGYYLLAEEAGSVVGLLPLIYMKRFALGSLLCSMPFLNYGGVLSDSPEVTDALICEAIRKGSELRTRRIEFRQTAQMEPPDSAATVPFVEKKHKVRMLLEFTCGSGEEFFQSLKSKLRNQVRRPQKEGMRSVIGGAELVDDFYEVFSRNMRDLGSPVHSKGLFGQIFKRLDSGQSSCGSKPPAPGSGSTPSAFDPSVKIGLVYHTDGAPAAAGLIVCFRDTVEIPWASSLRAYNRLGPNMLLYWSLMEFAVQSKYRFFDFGRSTPEEGTFKFKEQWGATQHPLHWYVLNSAKRGKALPGTESRSAGLAVEAWRRLPLFFANRLGPRIRGSIPL